MKRLLVPTDGSGPSQEALALALDLARHHGAEIVLMHVLLRDKEAAHLLRLSNIEAAGDNVLAELKRLDQAPKTPLSPQQVMENPNAPTNPAPEPILRAIGAHILAAAKALAEKAGVQVDTLDLADGDTATTIVATAQAQNVDTIIMGMRGLRQIDMITFGSVSQEVCRTAPCGCIAVHPATG